MKYILIGVVGGILAAFIPFSSYSSGDYLLPQWHGNVNSLKSIKRSPFLKDNTGIFGYLDLNTLKLLHADGSLEKTVVLDSDMRIQPSSDYSFYAQYGKVASTISLHSRTGERFWVKESNQYPRLSKNGELVLLQISDLSGIYLCDKSGSPVGDKFIVGKMSVAISFAENSDMAVVGFINGSYYVIGSNGFIAYEGHTPDNHVVKGAALSRDGSYCIIHHGVIDRDMITLINLGTEETVSMELSAVHKTRTGLAVSESGDVHVIDGLYYSVFDNSGDKIFDYEITPQIYGHARVRLMDSCSVIAYRTSDSSCRAYVFDRKFRPLLGRQFKGDRALDVETADNVILLKGTEHLEAWSLQSDSL